MRPRVRNDDHEMKAWLLKHSSQLIRVIEDEGFILPNIRENDENQVKQKPAGSKTRKFVRAFVLPPEYVLAEMKADLETALAALDYDEMGANFFVLARAVHYF